MSETKPDPHPYGDPNGGSNHVDGRPYWRRAHHDWRFYVAVALMLMAMLVYVMRAGFVGVPVRQPPPTASVPVEK